MQETDLYKPVKALFEAAGFTVKAEIGHVDVMARHSDGRDVIIELKLGFTLTVLHQAIARQAISDDVYIAVPKWKSKAGWKTFKGNINLCKRLGLGLIAVDIVSGLAKIYCDPAPFTPRKSKLKKARLVTEFDRRKGDPNVGGSTRTRIMTSYRQDALRCAKVLFEHGPSKGIDVAKSAEVPRATRMMSDNHYGWFERVGHGVYTLTHEGKAAYTSETS